MDKSELLYEGKAKKVFSVVGEDHLVIQEFKDSLTAFNGEKKSEVLGKGRLNQKISVLLYQRLEESGIATHFREELSDTEMLIEKLAIIPVEIVVRNITAGSLCKRYGLKEGEPLSPPLLEFYLKNDELGDPLLSESHLFALNLMDVDTFDAIRSQALKINEVLRPIFDQVGLELVDFKLEFGKNSQGVLLLGDEISPDTCRIWDKKSGEKLDKDRFRFDLGSISSAYQRVFDELSKSVANIGGTNG